jgi:UPF0755 protein
MKRALFILVLFLSLGAVLAFWPGTGADWVEFDVTQGDTGHDVAKVLQEKGLITMTPPFLVWMRLRGAGSKLKVGRYRFLKGRASWWIVDDLINGRTQKMKLIIPEGFSSWQIAQRLDEMKICSKDDFLKVVREKNLEGFLFPATYELDTGHNAETVAEIFHAKFEEKWNSDQEARAKNIGMTKKQAVTLASIIEREAMVPEERALISSVYHNRLRRKMPLQADPTVQYALGYWKQRLLYSDYQTVKSPYNTYLYAGLPPGPICSPGLPAINAALAPAQTDYLYFVASEGGHHNFSNNYRDHTNKVNKRNKTKRGR